MKTKTFFIGSNWESLEVLRSLHKTDFLEIQCVITQPDRPIGRKQILTPTEVKQFAIENNIPVEITNSDPKKYQEVSEKYSPELVVCIAFGEIIPEFFLERPQYKAINVHFSLLPKYRGAVPIQMAILNGEKTTGISVVQMVKEMDAGPVLVTFEEDILENDTNQSLRERLVRKSAEELPIVLNEWIAGVIKATNQKEEDATYCYKADISKDKAEIEWDKMDADLIERMVRAFIPWPITWTQLHGKRTKILEVKIAEEFSLKPGEILDSNKQLVIGCLEGAIEVYKLQPEGKNIMDVKQYLAGNKK